MFPEPEAEDFSVGSAIGSEILISLSANRLQCKYSEHFGPTQTFYIVIQYFYSDLDSASF